MQPAAQQLSLAGTDPWVEREVVTPRSGRPLELVYHLVRVEPQLADMVSTCSAARDISHDTESSGLTPALGARATGHSLACQTRSASEGALAEISMWYVPVRHVLETEPQLPVELVSEAVRAVLYSPGRCGWAHAKHDWAMLRADGVYPATTRQCHDVLTLASVHNENEPDFRLKSLAEKYAFEGAREDARALSAWLREDARALGMKFEHRRRDEEGELDEPSYLERFGYARSPAGLCGRYACRDVLYTLYLWLVAFADIPARYPQVYARDMALARELHEMEWGGLPLDEPLVRQTYEQTGLEINYWLDKVREFAGMPDFGATDDELRELLFTTKGLVAQKWTGGGQGKRRQASIDREARELLRHKYPEVAPLLTALGKLSDARKYHGTYGAGILKYYSHATGRIYPAYNALERRERGAPRTGRLSSEKPNAQNISRAAKIGQERGEPFEVAPMRYFLVPEGCVRLYADFVQIELKKLAWFCQDPNLLSAYPPEGPDRDVHQITSDLLSVERNPTAKQVNFLTIYGGTEVALSQRLGERYYKDPEGTRAYAADVIERFHQQYPAIRAFERAFAARARKNNCAFVNPFGRPRRIPDLVSPEGWRRAAAQRQMMSSIVSGTAADLMKESMLRCGGYLRERSPRSGLVQSIHDELVFDLERARWRELTSDIRALMQDWPMFSAAGPGGYGQGVGIRVSCKVVGPGGRWPDKRELLFDAHGRVANPEIIE